MLSQASQDDEVFNEEKQFEEQNEASEFQFNSEEAVEAASSQPIVSNFSLLNPLNINQLLYRQNDV